MTVPGAGSAQRHRVIGHPFFAEVSPALIAPLAAYATPATFFEGERILAEGQPASRLWLIEDGEIALDIQIPGRGTVVVETIGPWTVLGWSWLHPPYRWHFGAAARQPTSAVEIDAAAARRLLDADPILGYALTRRFLGVVVDRLQGTRMRLLDMYSGPGGG